jgi:papain like cysteine protease AvrRpt2
MRGRAVGKPSIASLNLDMQQQERDLWCWAAVSVSVRRFYDPSRVISQCEQASAQIFTADCCSDPSKCDMEWPLSKALNGLGVLRDVVNGIVPLTTIAREINDQHPLGCRIVWEGGAGHFVCIAGYDGTLLMIKDPLFGSSRVPYDEFAARYLGRGKWTHTYFTQP